MEENEFQSREVGSEYARLYLEWHTAVKATLGDIMCSASLSVMRKMGRDTPRTKEMLSSLLCLLHKGFFDTVTRVSLYRAPECRASRSQEGCDSLSGEIQQAELEAKLELLSLIWAMLGQEEGNKTTEVQRQMYELEEVRHKSWGRVETRGSSKDRSSMECYQMVSI